MALEIKVISGPKGSNPGGKCIVPSFNHNPDELAYIKYCEVNTLYSFGLDVQNQPVYEAISLEMATDLGLQVPEYEVILNRKGGVNFSYLPCPGERVKPLNPQKNTYFLSRFIPHNVDDSNVGLVSLMDREKIFRDLLNLGDVSGRAQNYSFVQPRDGSDPFVVYIDIGCGLVDAHQGRLDIRSSLRRKVVVMDRKKLGKLAKKLSRWEIETPFGLRINLGGFGEAISDVRINVVDAAQFPLFLRRVPIKSLLSPREIEQLKGIYFSANEDFLKKYSGDERVFRIKH